LRSTGAETRGNGVKQDAKRIGGNSKENRYHHIKAIEETQFRKLREVADEVQVGGKVGSGSEPAHVAPEESVLLWRVRVSRLIRVSMMMSMMRSPP
jgi:hypothetical protein